MLRASTCLTVSEKVITRNGKTVAYNSDGELVAPNGSIGFAGAKKANGISNNGQTAKMSS